MSDEDDLFGKAMRGVRRIETKPRRVAGRSKGSVPLTHRDRPEGIVAETAPRHRPESAEEPWVLKASGVSDASLRQLAGGRPGINAECDLHGMTRDEMYRTLSMLMEQAIDNGWRVLCLVHGRGLHSQEGRPVLKLAVYEWLRDGPYAGWVLGVVPKAGTGGGSALVLLRRRR